MACHVDSQYGGSIKGEHDGANKTRDAQWSQLPLNPLNITAVSDFPVPLAILCLTYSSSLPLFFFL